MRNGGANPWRDLFDREEIRQDLCIHSKFLIPNQNEGGVETHSTRQGLFPALTSLWGAVGRK